jgi:hypothetical protein
MFMESYFQSYNLVGLDMCPPKSKPYFTFFPNQNSLRLNPQPKPYIPYYLFFNLYFIYIKKMENFVLVSG